MKLAQEKSSFINKIYQYVELLLQKTLVLLHLIFHTNENLEFFVTLITIALPQLLLFKNNFGIPRLHPLILE